MWVGACYSRLVQACHSRDFLLHLLGQLLFQFLYQDGHVRYKNCALLSRQIVSVIIPPQLLLPLPLSLIKLWTCCLSFLDRSGWEPSSSTCLEVFLLDICSFLMLNKYHPHAETWSLQNILGRFLTNEKSEATLKKRNAIFKRSTQWGPWGVQMPDKTADALARILSLSSSSS